MSATSGETATGRTHEPCTIVLYRTSKEDALLRRARGEYREMPGMRLTIEQAMRLWDLDRRTCQSLLNSLVAARLLEIDSHGRYRKAHRGTSACYRNYCAGNRTVTVVPPSGGQSTRICP
jgi:hypothetical protein